MNKIIVGTTPQLILSEDDLQFLRKIEQNPMSALEYTLSLWDALEYGVDPGEYNSGHDYAFNHVLEAIEVARPAGLSYFQAGEEGELWEGQNAVYAAAEQTMVLLRKLFRGYWHALRSLPSGQGEADGPFESITVDSIQPTYTVLNAFRRGERYPNQPTSGYSTFAEPWVSRGCPPEQSLDNLI